MTSDDMERAIARLFEGQELLTGKVAELTEDVARMREEAAKDRETMQSAIDEMREGLGIMIRIAEAMEANVVLLTQAQQGNSRRISAIERRIDAAGIPQASEREDPS